jgi:hypothetical protein
MTIPTLRPVRQFCQEHKEFPEGGVRYLIFNAATNGLAESGAIVRNGRRILIWVEKWYEWICEKRSAA